MYQKIMIAVFFFACRESGTGQGRVLGRSWQVIRTCAILTKRSVACRTVLLKYWSIFNAKTIKKAVIPEELRHEAGLPFPAEKYVITWLGSLIASWLLSYGQEPNPIIFKSQKFSPVQFSPVQDQCLLACRESGTGQGRVLGPEILVNFQCKNNQKSSDTGGTSTWGRLAVSSWKICNHMIGVLNCKLASQLWSGAQSHNIQESEILTCTVFPGSRPMLSRFFTPLLLLSFVTWCYSGWKELHTKMC